MQTSIHLVRFSICSIITNTRAQKSNKINVHIGKTLQKYKQTIKHLVRFLIHVNVCSITIINNAWLSIHRHRRGQRFGLIMTHWSR